LHIKQGGLFKLNQNYKPMNDYYNVKRLALILAVQAEIEGMKAENMQREQLNQSMAYCGTDFNNKAEELRDLTSRHNLQL
jgi:hypothetical protein